MKLVIFPKISIGNFTILLNQQH